MWANDLGLTELSINWLAAAFIASLTCTALVILAVATGASDGLDLRMFTVLRLKAPLHPDGKPKRLATAARDLTALGGDTLRGLILLIALVALGCNARWWVAGALAAIFAAARLALAVMKALIRRPRPPAQNETITTYTTSFPSGHTFMTGVLYLSAAILIPTGQAPLLMQVAIGAALFLSLSIGVTRVSFGVHWPSDVVAGWLASITWTTGSIFLLALAVNRA